MKRSSLLLAMYLPVFHLLILNQVSAEGTKQIYPAGWGFYKFYLSTDPIRNDFALYGCPETERLNIEILNAGEIIYYGFNDGANTNGFFYRIKDPTGFIVVPQTQIPTSGPGFISTLAEARIGPNTIYAGGYNPLAYVTESAGTYYIEFTFSGGDKDFEYMDITVANPADTTEIPGRLWSKGWQLTTTGGQQQCGSKMFVYTDDYICTSVNFNGMRPYAFDISCNQTGCAQTGNFLEDRKSRPGRHLYPQYKIFLNNPDSLAFPTGVLGQIDSISYTTNCNGFVYFTIWVNKNGSAEILLDIYPPAGYNAGDIKLPTAVFQGSTGNLVTWNGLDGFGLPVPNGTNINVTVSYLNGLTHLPIYDAEYSLNYNPNWTGYIVQLVRPSGPQPALFWNDSLCGGGANLTGCVNPTGCHTWNYNQGNEKTINTWWYAVSTSSTPVTIVKKMHMSYDSLYTICQGDSVLINGVYRKTTGNYQIPHTSVLTGCDSIEVIHLTVNPRPVVDLGNDVWICEGFTHPFDAGPGVGYTYQWDNLTTGQLNIANTQTYTTGTQGFYKVTVNNTYNCPNSDSVNLFVNPKPNVTNNPMSDTICSHSTFTLNLTSAVPSTTFSWVPTIVTGNITGASSGSGTTISHTLINTVPTNSTLRYTITPTSGGCVGNDTNYFVVVKPKPVVTTTPLTYALCSPDTITINLSSQVAGATFAWVATATSGNVSGFSGGSGSVIQQGLTNTGYGIETVTYKVAATANGCTGDTVTFMVTLKPRPDLTTVPLIHSQCNNLNTGITLTSNVPGTLFTWTATASSGNLSGQGNSVTPGTAISQTISNSGFNIDTVYYAIVPQANSCSGDTSIYKVAVFPTPDLSNSPASKAQCDEVSTNITLTSNVAGTLFTWTCVPSSGNVTGFSDNMVPSTLIDQILDNTGFDTETVTYQLTPSANGCDGVVTDYVVTVYPTPDISNSILETGICSGQSTGITLTSHVTGTLSTWTCTQTSGTITGWSVNPGPGSMMIDQTLLLSIWDADSLFYHITPHANGCDGEVYDYKVTVFPVPELTVSPMADSICSETTTNIQLTSTCSGTSYTWTAILLSGNISGFSGGTGDLIAQTLTNNLSIFGSVNYTIIPSTSTCTGLDTTYTVTVKPTPHLTNSPAGDSICSNTSPNITLTSDVTGTTFTWTCTPSSGNVTGWSDNATPTILLNQTLVNSGFDIEWVIYHVTPAANGCDGPVTDYTVTVFPVPDLANSPLTQAQCNNLNTNITLTSNVAGTLFTWTATGSSPNISGFSDNSTPATLINHVLVNSGSNTETVTYQITPHANGCNGVIYTFVVTVYPTPDLTNNPLNQAQCNNANTNITLTSNVAGTLFTWTADASSGNVTGFSDNPVPSTLVDHTLVNSGFDTETVTYHITPHANNCTGIVYDYIVTVFPTPDLSFNPPSQTLCSGETSGIGLSSNVSGTTFTWTVSASSPNISGHSAGTGNIIAQTLSNSGTTVEWVTYQVTPAANGCNGPLLEVVITVNPVTHVTSFPLTQAFCSGGSAILSLTADVTGTTFSWTATPSSPNLAGFSDGSGDLIDQTITNSGYTIETVTYTITPTANGCDGPDSTFLVTVYPIPDLSNDPLFSELCNNTSTNIALLSNVSGTNFSWTATPSSANIIGWSAGSGTLIDQVLTNTGFNIEWVTYHITPAANGCTGATYDFVVTVVSQPDVYFDPAALTICDGQNTNIQVLSHVASATFTWTAMASSPNLSGYANGSGPVIDQTITNSGTTIETVTYVATPEAFGCPPGIPDSVIVTVNPTPYVNNNPLTQAICSGTSTNFPLSSTVPGTTYSWTASASSPDLSGFSDDSGPVIAQTITNAGYTTETVTYQITPTANGCAGPDSLFVATVFPVPDLANDPKDTAICSGQPTGLTLLSNVAGTQFTWTASGSSANVTGFANNPIPAVFLNQILVNTGYNIEWVTYHITPTANGCEGLVTDFTVTVYPVPDLSNTPASTAICNGTGPNVTLTSNVSGTLFTWTATGSSFLVTGFSDQTTPTDFLNQILTNSGSAIETVTYHVTPQANGCSGLVTDFVVTVYPTPDLSNDPPSKEICNNTGPNVLLTSNVTNTLFTWTATGSSGFVSGYSDQTLPTTLLNQTLINTGSDTEWVTYHITPHANGCSGTVWDYTVTVFPVPDVSNDPMNHAQCNNTFTGITLTSQVANTLFTWSATSSSPLVTGYSDNSVPVDLIDQQLVNPTFTGQTVTYHITPHANGCSGIIWDYTVTIYPTPDLSNSPVIHSQCNDQSTAVALQSNVTGTTFTWRAFSSSVNLSGFSNNPGPGSTLINQVIHNAGYTIDTVIYRLVPNANNCSGDSADYRVVVFPTPDMSNNPPATQICNNTPTGITLTSNVAGTLFTWTCTPSSGNITGWSNNAIPTMVIDQTLVNGGLMIETVTYHITPSANGCNGPDTNYVVTVVQSPDVFFNPPAQTICSEATSGIQILSNVPGTTFTWTTASSSPNLSGYSDGSGDLIAQTVTNSETTIETVTYTVYPTAWGCPPGQPQPVILTVNPEPVIINADTTFQICSATNTLIIPQSSVANTSYSWVAAGSSGNVTGYSNGSGMTIVQTLLNSGFDVETVTYTITPIANNCTGDARDFVVTVFPVADAYYDPNGQAICSGETCNIAILSHVAGSTFTWTATGSSGNVTGYSGGSGNLIQQTLVNSLYNIEYVTYTVSPAANGCPGTPSQVVVTVNPLPGVDYPVCTDILTTTMAQPLRLKGGTPLGGTYSGTGVSNGIFYPGIAGEGTHTIRYTYTNAMGCTSEDSLTLSVMAPAAFTCGNTLTDIRDGKIYPTVPLGTQCWMAANLNYGNVIASSQVQRDNCQFEKYCVSDNPANCVTYGGLYQWDEMMNYIADNGAQGFCPPEWHIPTESEWNTLFSFFISNGFAGSALKSSGFSGFNALLQGVRFNNSVWRFLSTNPVLRSTLIWSSTARGNEKAWAHGMNEVVADTEYTPSVSFYPSARINAFLVRCLKD